MRGIFFAADEIASDLTDFSYPYKEFYAENLKKGEIVTWNPYVGSGTPILAEAQTGVFHPLNLLLFRFLPVPVAFNWRIILSFILLSITTYLYARTIKLSVAASFISAISFTFSGFMIGHLKHVPMLGALEMAPLAFLATEKIIFSKNKLFFSLLLSLLLALSVFAGHLTSTYLLALFLVVYFFLRIFQEKQEREKLGVYVYFFSAFIAAILLAAVQVLPVYEVIPFSTRAETSLAGSLTVNFLPRYLLFFLKPDILGDPSRATWNMNLANYWENLGYIGLLPLGLALLAIVKFIKDKKIFPLLVIGGLTLALTLGSSTPLYKFFWDFLPGFSVTRIPGRFLFFVELCLVVLSGFGLDYLRKKLKLKLFIVVLIIILTIVDLFIFGYSYNNALPLKILEEPQTSKFVKENMKDNLFRVRQTDRGTAWQEAWQKAGGWRGNLSTYIDYWATLSPDHNILYNIASPSLIYQLRGHFGILRAGEIDAAASQSKNDWEGWEAIYGLMNVKYFIVPAHLDPFAGRLKTVFNQKTKTLTINILENPKFLPRAFPVSNYKVLNSDELLNYIRSADFQPAKEILLEEEPGVKGGADLTGSKVNITGYQNNKVEIDALMTNPGFLLLSDTWYPGWKATVDGKEQKIYRADYNFRAVYLLKGEHKIIFSYTPTFWRSGTILSLLSFFSILIILIILLTKYFKK